MPITKARNDKELANMLSIPVMKGLEIMAEQYLQPDVALQVESRLTGNFRLSASQGDGGLAHAWRWDSIGGYVTGLKLGEFRFYYDSRLLKYNPGGRHQTPEDIAHVRGIEVQRVDDMATLIDQGLGGLLFGFGNPTRHPTHFWSEGVIPSFKINGKKWIKAGLTSAGLSVR